MFLNGQPMGSVAFNATTASTAVNSVKLSIPPSLVHAGQNTFEIRVNMIPLDTCTQTNFGGMYTNIWPASVLHLPLTITAQSESLNFNLANYPAPFTYDNTLASTAFVLPKDDWEAWRSALRVASYLGNASHGGIIALNAFYADDLPAPERPKYNLLMIGRASQLPILNEIDAMLPAPFASNSDIAVEPETQVTFRIPPNTPLGYVELLPSPWNENRVMIAALGGGEQGEIWAASHLIEPLSFALKGNFAAINDTNVMTVDTRIASMAPLASTEVPATSGIAAVQAVPPALNPDTPAPVYRSGWILPALLVTILLILATILIAVYMNWAHNHPTNKNSPLGFLLNVIEKSRPNQGVILYERHIPITYSTRFAIRSYGTVGLCVMFYSQFHYCWMVTHLIKNKPPVIL